MGGEMMFGMGFGMLAAVIVILSLGFALGYLVGRQK